MKSTSRTKGHDADKKQYIYIGLNVVNVNMSDEKVWSSKETITLYLIKMLEDFNVYIIPRFHRVTLKPCGSIQCCVARQNARLRKS